jgi:hypothetical protein
LNNFDEIRRIVMADPGLMPRLTETASEADLFTVVMGVARAHGIELTVAELQGIVRTNRVAWFERWVPS